MPSQQPMGHSTASGPTTTTPQTTTQAVDQEVLQSSALLGPRQAIEIEHNGQRYRLQSTKSGKLILTK